MLIVEEVKSGAMVMTDGGRRIDARLKTEEVVRIAGSSMVFATQWSKNGQVKESKKTPNVSGV